MGVSLRSLVRKYGIPKDTIDRKAKGLYSLNPGGQTSLSPAEETKLVQNIHLASKWGFPLTSIDVRYLVKSYLDSAGKTIKKFNNNLPGRDWMRSFLFRHKGILSERWCENIVT